MGNCRALVSAGIKTNVTVAPILPCDPDSLVRRAARVCGSPVIADPLHVREVKKSGATTREPAIAICRHHGWQDWLNPEFQQAILMSMKAAAEAVGCEFGHGPAGFAMLTRVGTKLNWLESYNVEGSSRNL